MSKFEPDQNNIQNKSHVPEYHKPSAIAESFSWVTSDFKTVDHSPNQIKIKGKALTSDVVSRNNRLYVEEELLRSARTLAKCPLTINHDFSRKAGHIEFSEFEDHAIEYIAVVNKQPYVDLLRNKSTTIKGVSVEADYLFNKCVKCGEKFESEIAFREHMDREHFVKVPVGEIHGMIFKALSLVLSPEEPGVSTATVQVMETAGHGINELFETIVKEKTEKKSGEPEFKLTEELMTDPMTGQVHVGTVKTRLLDTSEIVQKVTEYAKTEKDNAKIREYGTKLLHDGRDPNLTIDQILAKAFPKKPESKALYEPCSPELRACVDDLLAQGQDEESAWAICRSKIGEIKTEQETIREDWKFLSSYADLKVREAYERSLKAWNKDKALLVQRAEDLEKKVGLRETVEERNALKETVTHLKMQVLELQASGDGLKAEVARRDGLVEANRKLQIENDNIRDKVKGAFRGKNKEVVSRDVSFPEDPNKFLERMARESAQKKN
jgi:regulator of replication initiation timing